MEQYVELLRAKRALIVAGIIWAVVLVIAVILRVVAQETSTPDHWLSGMKQSPTARVTESRLPDGSTKYVVDDPAKRKHAVMIRGAGGVTINMTQPSSEAKPADNFSAGEFHMQTQTIRGVEHVNMTYHPMNVTWDVGWLFGISMAVALVVASILGGVLAKENNGHLELAWTKPVSRERYAASAFAVDIAAIVAAQLVGIVALLLGTLLFAVPKVAATPSSAAVVAVSVLAPIAWYAMLTALSASIRSPGAVCGAAWGVGLVVPIVAALTSSAHTLVVTAIHGATQAISYVDPVAYIFSSNGHFLPNGVITTAQAAALVLAALAIVYFAAALAQWRRVEA